MEINKLEFAGVGTITDHKSGRKERINLKADLDLAQLVISLEQELTSDGFLVPKIDISEVAFTLHPQLFNVDARGDLPLY